MTKREAQIIARRESRIEEVKPGGWVISTLDQESGEWISAMPVEYKRALARLNYWRNERVAALLKKVCVILLAAIFAGCADHEDSNDFALRGDLNNDGIIDEADVAFLDDFLFGAGDAPVCFTSADVNHDGVLDSDDSAYLRAYVEGFGLAPVDEVIFNCSEPLAMP